MVFTLRMKLLLIFIIGIFNINSIAAISKKFDTILFANVNFHGIFLLKFKFVLFTNDH